jgi:predicted transcriptional regulator
MDGWKTTGAVKRVIVLVQPYDLFLVGRAQKASEKDSEEKAPSQFIEDALREFLHKGTNGGKQDADKAMREATSRREKGEQLSRRSIRLSGDVSAQLDDFAHDTEESPSIVVEAALDRVLNGEIEEMRGHLAEAKHVELGDTASFN